MSKVFLFRKEAVFGIIFLFVCGGFATSLSSSSTIRSTPFASSNVVPSESSTQVIVSSYTFGKTADNKHDVALTQEDATMLFEKLAELRSEMTQRPFSEKTQRLKRAFVDLLDEKGLIPNGVSKQTYLSLLNPAWVERIHNSAPKASSPQILVGTGTSVFCSVGGEGSGVLMPLFLLPRPRLAMLWLGNGLTTAANLLTSKGYIAEGAQTGFTLGFMGLGLSYAIPGYTIYGFIGYALLASTTAEYVAHYPPNRAPVVSETTPADNEQNVPLSLTELQFQIVDDDGDLMSYTVTTEPDIGSASGTLKPLGVYSVPVSSLKANSLYTWTVEVSDGKDTTIQEFSFNTVEVPFNPFDEGWLYRKQISLNHSMVAGNLNGFPVFVHTVDADVQAKAQADGDDILFMEGPGVAYRLYHEIESYDSTTGEVLAWVNVMNLSADEDTVVYMYYGNPASGNGQTPERLWAPYFAGVWHLRDFLDSTPNENHGSNYGSIPCSGKIGDARQFDGGDDDIIVNNNPSLNFHTANKFSISLWIKRDRVDIYESVISKATSAHMAGYAVQIRENNTILLVLYDGSQDYAFHSNQMIVDTNWHYISAVWDGTQQYIFIDGALDNSRNIGAVSLADDSKPLEVGHHYGYINGKNPFAGCVDEIQISKTDRKADWIFTSYMNQQNPLNFMNFGPEEPHP